MMMIMLMLMDRFTVFVYEKVINNKTEENITLTIHRPFSFLLK